MHTFWQLHALNVAIQVPSQIHGKSLRLFFRSYLVGNIFVKNSLNSSKLRNGLISNENLFIFLEYFRNYLSYLVYLYSIFQSFHNTRLGDISKFSGNRLANNISKTLHCRCNDWIFMQIKEALNKSSQYHRNGATTAIALLHFCKNSERRSHIIPQSNKDGVYINHLNVTILQCAQESIIPARNIYEWQLRIAITR